MKNIVMIALCLLSFSCTAQRGSFRNMVERDGKVGIGTRTPDELLTVKGKIHTQEVLVDLNGAVAPDYVFDQYLQRSEPLNPDYEFISLQDLELFIKDYGHLPGIPSAAELERDGMSLKDMNLRLLEKIEELTLYTLQQQKEIDILKNELEEIKKKN